MAEYNHTSYDEFIYSIDSTAEKIKRYLARAPRSSPQAMLYRDFCGFLQVQRRLAQELRRSQPNRSFGREHEEISKEAFSVERKLLRFSLQEMERRQDYAWFLDSGFRLKSVQRCPNDRNRNT